MMKRILILSITSLIFLSILVLGAGSSTSGFRNTQGNITNSTNQTVTTCESETLRERINCRLQNHGIAIAEANKIVEESCRGHANETTKACEKLYKNSAKCYGSNSSVERKQCFLKESGVNINAGETFRQATSEIKRDYVVLLFYELQERIESAQKDGKITTEQATSLIEKIIVIKKMVISGEPRTDIIVKINEFKIEYRQVMSGVNK